MSRQSELAELGRVYATAPLSNRNLIINGAMQVAQRGTSFTLNSSSAYTLDRWRSQGTYDAEVLTVEQSTDAPDGFGNSLKVTVSTAEATADAADYHFITQKFEGQDLQKLDFGASSAKALSFSFWVKASIAQTYCVSLYQVNGNKHYSQTYTVNSANTWEYKTVSITGNTANELANDNSGELEIGFMLGAGTNYTSGSNDSWGGAANFAAGASHTFMTTANATFQITGVQLEVGDTATPFEHRSYGDELARCQRYYYRSDGIYRDMGVSTTGYATTEWAFPVQMRAVGSAEVFGYPSGVSGRVSYFTGTWNDTSSFSFPHIGPNYLSIQYNNVAVSQMGLSFTVDAEL